MKSIHHATLKAAIAKYGPLHTEGKLEGEVKAEIAKDEKEFDKEQVDFIYQSIVTPSEGDQQNNDKKVFVMKSIHHATLKAAIAKYGPLHTEGKLEGEVKAEIAKDEKEFDKEQVDFIYQSIVTPSEGDQQNNDKKVFHVAIPFRDKADFSREYKVGEDVSHFDQARINHLISIQYVEEVNDEE